MSLLILKGPLDPVAVDHVRRVITALTPDTRRVRLICSRISALDPIGVAGLWRLCCEARLRGLEIALVGLPARLARRLRRHPIMEFAGLEEELYRNPLASLAPSDR